jgi:hypothetical protein
MKHLVFLLVFAFSSVAFADDLGIPSEEVPIGMEEGLIAPVATGDPDPLPAIDDVEVSMPAAEISLPSPEAKNPLDLAEDLLSYWNILLMAAIWTLLQTVKRALPDDLFDEGTKLWRAMHFAPVILTNAAVWIPGPWMDASAAPGERIVLATVLGFLTSHFHSIASKFGLHKFLRIEADTRKLPTKPKKPTLSVVPDPPNEGGSA